MHAVVLIYNKETKQKCWATNYANIRKGPPVPNTKSSHSCFDYFNTLVYIYVYSY